MTSFAMAQASKPQPYRHGQDLAREEVAAITVCCWLRGKWITCPSCDMHEFVELDPRETGKNRIIFCGYCNSFHDVAGTCVWCRKFTSENGDEFAAHICEGAA